MNNPPAFIVGIAGGSGSGKTTFLHSLLSHFSPSEVALVSQDNYYRALEFQHTDENGVVNFDLPTSIDHALFVRDMEELATGKVITKMEYNFNNPAWTPRPVLVQPAPVILMEGLFVFHFNDIRQRLNYKVFLDAHPDERLNRRIRRDKEERGYPEEVVRYQWHQHVRPSEEQFLIPFVNQCDLVVDNTSSFDTGLNQLVEVIRKQLG